MHGKRAGTAASTAVAGVAVASTAAACLLGAAVPGPAEAAAAPAVVTAVPCRAAALASAMSSASSGDTLSLAAGCAYRQAALPAVTIDLTIAGNGATLVDSNLEVDSNILTVAGLNFRRSRLLVDGIGAATVRGGTFTGGTSDGNGGAIDDEGGATNQLIVTGATFAGNTAAGSGGAIYDFGYGEVDIDDDTFIGNRAPGGAGGAVSLNPNGASNLSDLVMRDNSAAVGGAIANYAVVIVTGSLISGNHASGAGGGIYSAGYFPGDLQVTGSVLGQNTAQQGAAIYNDIGGSADIAGTTIAHNDASESGGGIYNNGLDDGTVALTDSRISYNQAGAPGGGIYSGQGQVAASGTVISRNTATAGGGIYSGGGTVSITGSPVVYNTPDNCEPASPGCAAQNVGSDNRH